MQGEILYRLSPIHKSVQYYTYMYIWTFHAKRGMGSILIHGTPNYAYLRPVDVPGSDDHEFESYIRRGYDPMSLSTVMFLGFTKVVKCLRLVSLWASLPH